MPFTRAAGGGSFISGALLAKGLIANGVGVLALFPEEGSSVEVFRKNNVPVLISQDFPVVQAFRKTGSESLRPINKITRTSLAASRFLAKQSFDIVHCNDDTIVLPWGIASKSCGIKTVWHVRSGCPGYTDLIRLLLADKIVCISKYVAARFSSRVKAPVLYNPAVKTYQISRTERAALRESIGIPTSAIYLLQVGRDVPYKRASWSISALQALSQIHPEVFLAFIGDFTIGRQQELLAPLPTSLRSNVFFRGWVAEPEPHLAMADILLHPAKGEHFGRLFAEASLMNLPFVATPTGAAPELIAEGFTGVLSTRDTMKSFCHKVLAIFDEIVSRESMAFSPPAWLDPSKNARMYLNLTGEKNDAF